MFRLVLAPFPTVLPICVFLLLPATAGAQATFVRGDANSDGAFNLDDALHTLRYLFDGVGSMPCHDSGDVDDSGRLDIVDPVYSLEHFFRGGPTPAVPFLTCGDDPTNEDALGCAEFVMCADVGGGDCLDAALLDELLVDLPELGLCLPAGLLAFELEGLAIDACPEEGAAECGLGGLKGCGLEIQRVGFRLDAEEQQVVVRMDAALSLPVSVTESLLGTTTTCDVTLGGEEAGTPMIIELVFPLVTFATTGGASEITGLGEPVVDLVDVNMDVDGGLVCLLFGALDDEFLALLTEPFALAADALVEPIEGLIAGLQLCE